MTSRIPRLACAVSVAVALTGCGFSGDTDGGDVTNRCGSVDGGKIGFAPGSELLGLTADQLGRELDLVAASGAKWLRVEISWASVEKNKGTFVWAQSEQIIRSAHDRGINVLGLLTYTPQWARSRTGDMQNDKTVPEHAADFGTFAAAAATNFRGLVSSWEIWNEPNHPIFFLPDRNVATYVDLLKAASTGIHRVTPEATIVTGGLAPSTGADGGIEPVDFVRKLYELGAGRYFDGIGLHPYSYPALPTDETTKNWNTYQKVAAIHGAMVDAGDDDGKLWFTEYGAPTGKTDRSVTEANQRAEIAAAITDAGAQTYIAKVLIYSIRDRAASSMDAEDYFGVLRFDFSPKQSYQTIQQLSGADCDS